jgi:streptomycin 6-kinase
VTGGLRLPAALEAEWRCEPAWLSALPRLVAECAEQWSLALERPVDTPHSLVVPARDLVLKLNAPSHFEADHEADALALWGGEGAVRLVDRDDERRALLIERCRPGRPLRGSGADERAVVTGLLTTLRSTVEPAQPFRLLADEAERWAVEVPAQYDRAGEPFERSLLELAVDVFESVDASAATLANQDLHGDNVLSATRAPWLVIDPKPLVGEPELNGVGPLRNAEDVASAQQWIDALAELGLDRRRLRAWGVAHALAWGWDERKGWSDWSVEAARTIAATR